jgi:hypothetical protein
MASHCPCASQGFVFCACPAESAGLTSGRARGFVGMVELFALRDTRVYAMSRTWRGNANWAGSSWEMHGRWTVVAYDAEGRHCSVLPAVAWFAHRLAGAFSLAEYHFRPAQVRDGYEALQGWVDTFTSGSYASLYPHMYRV